MKRPLLRMAEIEARVVAKREARLALQRLSPRPLVFHDARHRLLVSPCPSEPGRWRVTSFDGEEPTGHTVRDTYAEAVDEACMLGGDPLFAADAHAPRDQAAEARRAEAEKRGELVAAMGELLEKHSLAEALWALGVAAEDSGRLPLRLDEQMGDTLDRLFGDFVAANGGPR